MDPRNLTFALFVIQPFVIWALPIRPLKGPWLHRILCFHLAVFCILTLTWDSYLLHEGTMSDVEKRTGFAIGLGLGCAVAVWLVSFFSRHDVAAVPMKKPDTVWGYSKAFEPPAGSELAKNPPPVIKANKDELAQITTPVSTEFSGATWLPVLLLAMAYNAATERQYDWDPGLRAALYLCFFFLCMPMAVKPWVTEPLLVPVDPGWDQFMTVVFEGAVCQYLAQMLTLYVRMMDQADTPNDRWHELPLWSIGIFVGLVLWRIFCYFYMRDRFWRRRAGCVCSVERRPEKPTAVSGGSQLEQTPLLTLPSAQSPAAAFNSGSIANNHPALLLK